MPSPHLFAATRVSFLLCTPGNISILRGHFSACPFGPRARRETCPKPRSVFRPADDANSHTALTRGRCREMLDLYSAGSLLSLPQIILQLRLQPAFRRTPECLGQPNRHVRGNPRMTIEQCRQRAPRDAKALGGGRHRQLQGSRHSSLMTSPGCGGLCMRRSRASCRRSTLIIGPRGRHAAGAAASQAAPCRKSPKPSPAPPAPRAQTLHVLGGNAACVAPRIQPLQKASCA
jgi:hypothetical protein